MTNAIKHITPPLILASASPRRKELLEQAGLSFTVVPSDVDEDEITITEPDHYVRYLAEAKARDIADRYPENWVLGADTIVLLDRLILGKPGTRDEAFSMLKKLSGRSHFVFTGFCLACHSKNRIVSGAVKTLVRFKELSDAEITWYVNTPEPYDKAGAYAIQGLGTFLVKDIEGSYTNVVGLPVCEIMETLLSEGAMTF
jgi:septum formation protein